MRADGEKAVERSRNRSPAPFDSSPQLQLSRRLAGHLLSPASHGQVWSGETGPFVPFIYRYGPKRTETDPFQTTGTVLKGPKVFIFSAQTAPIYLWPVGGKLKFKREAGMFLFE